MAIRGEVSGDGLRELLFTNHGPTNIPTLLQEVRTWESIPRGGCELVTHSSRSNDITLALTLLQSVYTSLVCVDINLGKIPRG